MDVAELIESAAAIVGAALVALKAVLIFAEKVAGVTPSNADDEAVRTAHRWLAVIVKIADRLEMNPDNVRARRSKEK